MRQNLKFMKNAFLIGSYKSITILDIFANETYHNDAQEKEINFLKINSL